MGVNRSALLLKGKRGKQKDQLSSHYKRSCMKAGCLDYGGGSGGEKWNFEMYLGGRMKCVWWQIGNWGCGSGSNQ